MAKPEANVRLLTKAYQIIHCDYLSTLECFDPTCGGLEIRRHILLDCYLQSSHFGRTIARKNCEAMRKANIITRIDHQTYFFLHHVGDEEGKLDLESVPATSNGITRLAAFIAASRAFNNDPH